jgi:hypothetical protein
MGKYWDNITKIYKKQESKGLSQYGQPLEFNKDDIMTRLLYIEEELVDGLLYIEWLKDNIIKNNLDNTL